MDGFLEKIRFPRDLKNLNLDELAVLASEIREFVITRVSKTGGHLAPSLGVVELTIALHHVFNTPDDKIVWDVGHQAYAHKILTGRKKQFHTLRQFGGISGFPKISESEYDAFGVGHASTAISAALGMATARDIQNKNHKVIAVVGDGAMTGGLAFEGLNNAGVSQKNVIVILNDNRMSISPNVGALSKYLNQIITTPFYNRIKKDIWDLTGRLPRGSKRIRNLVQRIEEGLKSMVVPGSLFERLGFRYFGPIDGHDLNRLIRIFREINKLNGPILVHVVTKKGKGYKFAEEDATKFHGPGPFCAETGNTKTKKHPTYTEIFGHTLVELAEKDKRIVGITAAMADGTGLVHLAEKYPSRFFDVGIAEQHAVTFAAAMAKQGLKPVVAIYSTFLQRSVDQIIHDVALQKLPVIFALDRGGLVGEDGPTHHGSFDLSYLRFIPNLVVMAPKDENELRDMMWTAVQYDDGPVAFRYPRGESYGLPLKKTFERIPVGKGEILRQGKDLAILAIGDRVYPALQIAGQLESEGIDAQVVNARFVRPMDESLFEKIIRNFPLVVTIENNSIVGGFGSTVAEKVAEMKTDSLIFKRFGLPDRFVTHGCLGDLLVDVGLDEAQLVKEVKLLLKRCSVRRTIKV